MNGALTTAILLALYSASCVVEAPPPATPTGPAAQEPVGPSDQAQAGDHPRPNVGAAAGANTAAGTPGTPETPTQDVPARARAAASDWYRASRSGDAAAAVALSAVPFSFDGTLLGSTEELRSSCEALATEVASQGGASEPESATVLSHPEGAASRYAGAESDYLVVNVIAGGAGTTVFLRRADLKIIGFAR